MEKEYTYKHTVQYYETDKMGVTHHSNYIRWMEEARISFLKEIDWAYDKLEAMGIISPIVNVSCNYRLTTTFPDEIDITIRVAEFKGVKLTLEYDMRNKNGKVVCDASSTLCFIDSNGRPTNIKKQFPDFYELILKYSQKDN